MLENFRMQTTSSNWRFRFYGVDSSLQIMHVTAIVDET